MIVPHPEDNLNLNIMVLGADIINILNSKRYIGKYVLVENVLSNFLKEDEKRTPDLFFNSLVFLYSIGLIDKKDYKIKLIPIVNTQFLLF
jgi:hypothetical protein